MRPRRLEVEEPLGIDVRDLLRIPQSREVAGGEGRALAAVVPAAKCGDQNRPVEGWFVGDPELVGHPVHLTPAAARANAGGCQSSAASETVSAQTAAASATCTATIPHGSSSRHWSSPDRHLREQHAEQQEREAEEARGE